MSVTVKPIPGFADEEPIEEITINTRLRYVAPDDEVWEYRTHFMRVVPAGQRWEERVTWFAERGMWAVELIDANDVQCARWNVAVPENVLWPLKKRRPPT